MYAVVIVTSLLMASDAGLSQRFSEVEIDDVFRPYLVSNRLLMDVAGAKIIRLRDGRSVVISVASTVLKDKSAKDRLRAERVCRTKALANIVAEQNDVQVSRMEILGEESRIVNDANGESGASVSEMLQVTKSKVSGIAKDMPVIGRWKSKEGDVLYLAIGAIVNKDGEVVVPQEP